MLDDSVSKYARRYENKKVWVALVLFVTYVAASFLTAHFIPVSLGINPATAIALTALFFSDLRFFPVVYGAALLAELVTGMPLMSVVFLPFATTLEAFVGAYLLRSFGFDPIFRHKRDAFYFIAVACGIALIVPTVSIVTNIGASMSENIVLWGHLYAGTLLSLIIPAPFLFRWFAKPQFSRTFKELLETLTSLAILITADIAFFLRGIESIFGIPLVYIVCLPLFWIALRLRPRFVTLALIITALFGISGIIVTDTSILSGHALAIELFLIAISIVFLVITTQEEERRVNTNRMHSQLATLENVIARVNTESNAKNDFIAVLAHELRNPLAPIVSSIDLLRLKGPRDAEEAEVLDVMTDRMKTIRYLLDDLLDVSRISEGKIVLNREQVNLELVLKASVLSTEHYREELHQRLQYVGPKKPLVIDADKVRIEQVFSNLLTNASKYSRSGTTIRMTVNDSGEFAEIEVSDQGSGLAAHELDAIFQPFYQTADTNSTGGLGIGLALVRNFVEMHGGTVIARSEGQGKGSRFIVRLPVIPQN